MKIVRILSALALMLSSTMAQAYDFSAVVPSGQTLYFNIENGAAVVTYPGSTGTPAIGWSGYTKPTGALTIPSTIVNGSETYAVVAVGSHALRTCNDITSLVVEEGVTEIRNSAFYDCTGMTSVVLPSTIVSIGNVAFKYCTSLAQFTMSTVEPPTTHTAAFEEASLSTCSLNLPCHGADSYSDVEPWSQFGTISEEVCEAVLTLSVNFDGRGNVSGGGTYSMGTAVVALATPADGFFFASWSDGDTSNPRIVQLQNDVQLMAMFFAKVHDTVTTVSIQHDTVTVFSPQHDTMYVSYPVHDTVTVAYPVHDTVFVSNVVHDTITLSMPQHDTVYVAYPVHDTVTSEVPVEVHDTVFVPLVMHDTIVVGHTDTVLLRDTIQPTFYRLQVTSGNASYGIGVGSCTVPAGTEIEIAAIAFEGYRFAAWLDGVTDNPRRVQVDADLSYAALFVEAPQTSAASVGPVWTMAVEGRSLTVSCPVAERIRILDMQGRTMSETTASADRTTFVMPAAGAFLVQVGNTPARKFVTK